jgi:hypothetical protein
MKFKYTTYYMLSWLVVHESVQFSGTPWKSENALYYVVIFFILSHIVCFNIDSTKLCMYLVLCLLIFRLTKRSF